jgi:hypothetical protein
MNEYERAKAAKKAAIMVKAMIDAGPPIPAKKTPDALKQKD